MTSTLCVLNSSNRGLSFDHLVNIVCPKYQITILTQSMFPNIQSYNRIYFRQLSCQYFSRQNKFKYTYVIVQILTSKLCEVKEKGVTWKNNNKYIDEYIEILVYVSKYTSILLPMMLMIFSIIKIIYLIIIYFINIFL